MLKFKQSDSSVKFILTLTELQTTSAPNYLFVFTHVLTKQAVSFTLANAQDESLFKERYNRFTIDPSSVFASKPTGEWHYKVYENNVNGVLLEQGKMIMDSETDFTYDKYNSETSFKVYNG